MDLKQLPNWIYWPLKIVLMIGFIVPLLVWGGKLMGLSEQQELAFIQQEKEKVQSFIKEQIPESSINKVNGSSTGKAHGIDVSHYQGKVRWDLVKSEGIDFAYIKSTGGDTYIDPQFKLNWQGAREAGISRGAYHFFYASDDPLKQATHFQKTIGQLNDNDLPPVVDIEISDHTDKTLIQQRLLVWLETVEQRMGKRPVIYSDASFINEYLDDERFVKYPLWIAEYSKEIKPLPSHWQKSGWKIWQYSQSGQLTSIQGHVDLNHFNGDANALLTFIKQSNI